MSNAYLDIKGIRIARIQKDGKAIELGFLTNDDRTLSLRVPTEQAEQIMILFVEACTVAKITQATRPPPEDEKRDWKPTPEIVYADDIQVVAQPAWGTSYLIVSTREGKELHVHLEANQLSALIELAQRVENTQAADGIH